MSNAGRKAAKPSSGSGKGNFWDSLAGMGRSANKKYQEYQQGIPKGTKLRDDTQYNKTLEDFLALAQQYMSGSSAEELGNIGNQETSLRRNAEDISNQLRGGYSGLSSFITGQAPVIQQGYEQGIQGSAEAAQRAQTAITEGTAAAQAQQQAIMNRLGIADANIPIANAGTTLEAGMAQQVADSAARGQNAQTELNSNMATALNFNTSQGTSSAVEGQGEQNRVHRDLLSRLAELADQRREVQSSSNSSSDMYGLAQSLMDQDYQKWSGNYDRKYNAQRDAMQMAQDQMAAQQDTSSSDISSTQASLLGTAGRAEYMLKMNGLDATGSSYIIDGLNRYVETQGQPTLQNLLVEAGRLASATGEDANMRILAQKAAMLYAEDFAG